MHLMAIPMYLRSAKCECNNEIARIGSEANVLTEANTSK